MTKYHVVDDEHGNALSYLEVKRMVEKLKKIDYNAFPDEIKANDITYILSEIGGSDNKLRSGENLGVYIPKDFETCLKVGSVKLTSEQATRLAV